MKRDYDTGTADSITFFTGVEVEKTPAFGTKTLFVTGVQDYNEIMKYYKEEQCEHIFFGANHSYNPVTSEEFEDWDLMIRAFTDKGILCSLDIPSTINLEWFMEGGLIESDNFIPQISVKIPNLTAYNTNATVKIDDIDFKATNKGVWCHSLAQLQPKTLFTDWSEYGNDEII